MERRSACIYQERDSHIHSFLFTIPSRSAVDEWLTYLDALYEITPADAPLCCLVDVCQSGILPMTYLAQRGREWLAAHPLQHSVRFAVLYSRTFPLTLAQTFLRLHGIHEGTQVRFFLADEYDTALHWLLAGMQQRVPA